MSVRLSEREMLLTLARMAIVMDDITGHDIVEALDAHGYGHIVRVARVTPVKGNVSRETAKTRKK